jgi:hypothetical protein
MSAIKFLISEFMYDFIVTVICLSSFASLAASSESTLAATAANSEHQVKSSSSSTNAHDLMFYIDKLEKSPKSEDSTL